jgi:hypothetical protein
LKIENNIPNGGISSPEQNLMSLNTSASGNGNAVPQVFGLH